MESFHSKAESAEAIEAVIAWAEQMEELILRDGEALSDREKMFARIAGVAAVDKVRVLVVSHIRPPENKALQDLAASLGFDFREMEGLTLGHGILIKEGCVTEQLLAHELRHVHQVEQHGSLAHFLTQYVKELADYGYKNSPLEKDARNFETVNTQ